MLEPDAKFRSRTRRRIEAINRTPERLAEAVRTARRRIDRIRASTRLTEEAKASDRAKVEEWLLDQLDQIATENHQARADLDALAAKVTSPDDRDPTKALLVEQRRNAAWQRLQRLLDSGLDPLTLAQRAASAQDRDALDALRAELPSLLESRGEDAATRHATLATVDQYAAAVHTPVERAVAEGLAAADEAVATANLAIDWVRRDGPTADAIPTAGGDLLAIGSWGSVSRPYSGGGPAHREAEGRHADPDPNLEVEV